MVRTKATARTSIHPTWVRDAVPRPASTTRVLRSQTAAACAARTRPPVPPMRSAKPRKRRHRADPWTPKRKPNPTPKPRKLCPPPTHFTCRICVEEQAIDQFPRWVPPKRGRFSVPWDVPFDCIAHLARNPRRKNVDPVCKTCIANTISAQLDTVGARRISGGCPEPGCVTQWSWDYIMQYIPKGEALEKYNIEMLEVWKTDATPKPVTCLAPDCQAIGLPDATAPGYPQVSCNSCAFRYCAQCLVPWHKDLTCAEQAAKYINNQMSDPEKDTLRLMQTKDAKRCPNCFLVVEKDGGCDSMFCTGCHKYFNWGTAASAVPGTTKARPIVNGNPYWVLHNGPVVCEMDAMIAKENETAAPIMAAA